MGAALQSIRSHAVAIDFQGLVKSAALGALSGAGTRYGFDRESIREKAATFFSNHPVHVDRTGHVVEQNLEIARVAVNDLAGTAPMEDPAGHRRRLAARLESFGTDAEGKLQGLEGSVVLLPGAGQARKLWPVERFRRLAAAIGSRALVAWGPGERDLAEAIGGRVAPPTGLRELAWLLRHAAIVIGADTGPLHLAAALGTKTVGLYGPTDPGRNGPWGQLDRCVNHFRCSKLMESISVEEVVMMLERAEAEAR